MFVYTVHVHARKDMYLYLVSFLYFTPPAAKALSTRPKERDLARIKVGRRVTQTHPVIYTWVVLAEGFRIKSRKGKALFVTSRPRLNPLGNSQSGFYVFFDAKIERSLGGFQFPVARISQIPIHMPQMSIHVSQT